MSLKRSEQIDQVWHLVYDLLRGPGAAKLRKSYLVLHPGFEDELLNDIAALKSSSDTDFQKTLEEVRAKISIAQATGRFGDRDLERINIELDKTLKEN